jgi:peptidoglycan/xylan/chitin deacetylase (PgdA/CDA1 family)
VTARHAAPGHTMITFPDSIRAVIDQGHEIAAHGAYHESVPSLGESEERRLMDLQLSQHEQIVGRRPRGYRSPMTRSRAGGTTLITPMRTIQAAS